MSKRKITLANEEYYHIYNRGNSKQNIFLDKHDKAYFIRLLAVLNQEKRKRISKTEISGVIDLSEKPLVAIGAYVAMDNHFHILLKQLEDEGITKFMQKVCTAYASYFNKKYKRVGGLYEGRFKAKHADNDIYLKYLYSYIHLNPAKLIDRNWKSDLMSNKNKDSILTFLNSYTFSSYQDYLGTERYENNIIAKEHFPDYFQNKKDFIKTILNGLSFGEPV